MINKEISSCWRFFHHFDYCSVNRFAKPFFQNYVKIQLPPPRGLSYFKYELVQWGILTLLFCSLALHMIYCSCLDCFLECFVVTETQTNQMESGFRRPEFIPESTSIHPSSMVHASGPSSANYEVRGRSQSVWCYFIIFLTYHMKYYDVLQTLPPHVTRHKKMFNQISIIRICNKNLLNQTSKNLNAFWNEDKFVS